MVRVTLHAKNAVTPSGDRPQISRFSEILNIAYLSTISLTN